MYSILPALVALLFLGFGAYVLVSRGANRVTLAFALVCVTTFSWQFTWSILFQVRDEALAITLARLGYLLIMFLPTTLYHFVVELTRQQTEQRWVKASYGAAALLGALALMGDQVLAGVYPYFFGYYPKAGPLHPLHVLQTALVVSRALYLLFRQQQVAVSTERLRLRYCLASLLIYFFAAVDYVCNYGVNMYPPGVLFIALSLGIIAQAIARHDLLANPMMLAATIAHEMRTPLATIRNQARVLAKGMPELLAAYEQAQRQGTWQGSMRLGHLDYLRELGQNIEAEVARSNFIADMVLASANLDQLSKRGFATHSVKRCVDEALARYPFEGALRAKVVAGTQHDFFFHGSDALMIYVLYNLLKNALAAVEHSPGGRIEIAFWGGPSGNRLTVSDTGHGIPAHVLPHVFDPFFTTRTVHGTGMGLAFCRRVITSFGGTISCRSHQGFSTTMWLELPLVRADCGEGDAHMAAL